MNRDTSSTTSHATPKPVDSDWPDRERAAEDEEQGDPRDVQDEGVLESLGKAVSSPVRDEIEPSARDGERPKK